MSSRPAPAIGHCCHTGRQPVPVPPVPQANAASMHDPTFSMKVFDITAIGAVNAIAGTAYMVLTGRKLLPPPPPAAKVVAPTATKSVATPPPPRGAFRLWLTLGLISVTMTVAAQSPKALLPMALGEPPAPLPAGRSAGAAPRASPRLGWRRALTGAANRHHHAMTDAAPRASPRLGWRRASRLARAADLVARARDAGCLCILIRTGCMTLKEAWSSVNGPVLLSIALSFALGEAIKKSDLATIVANKMVALVAPYGCAPHASATARRPLARKAGSVCVRARAHACVCVACAGGFW